MPGFRPDPLEAGLVLAVVARSVLGAAGRAQDCDVVGLPRRLTDFLRREEVILLRLSTLAALGAFAVSILALLYAPRDEGLRALTLCDLAAIVVLVSRTLANVLVSRPLSSSTPKGRLRQEGLLAATLADLPRQTYLVGFMSGVSAIVALTPSSRPMRAR